MDRGRGKRALRKSKRIARKIVDELIALSRERFVVRFATGYGMTWAQQKKALGDKRVAARGLDTVNGFANQSTNDFVIALVYPKEAVELQGRDVKGTYIPEGCVAPLPAHDPLDDEEKEDD